MQNTYYLPPAHSKPFVDPCPSTDSSKKSPLKAASPTFFDIFKFGKKQSSGSEQKPTIAPSGPMLRTTSDTSTFSGFLSPQPSKYPKQQLSVPGIPTMRPEPKKGRVVVVRERMEDLELVARQVEEDLKIREAERRRNASISSQSEVLQDDLVDPTDCVDLPPAPSNIFFGPQASILNGMGVETSVGAALLADQLPPSSPAMWSTDSDDMAWRKALLHAAVDHSMNNTPVATASRSRSTPVHSFPLMLQLPHHLLFLLCLRRCFTSQRRKVRIMEIQNHQFQTQVVHILYFVKSVFLDSVS